MAKQKGPRIGAECPECGTMNIRQRLGKIKQHKRQGRLGPLLKGPGMPLCEGGGREWIDAVNAGIVRAVECARQLVNTVPEFRRQAERAYDKRLLELDAEETWAKAVLATHGTESERR